MEQVQDQTMNNYLALMIGNSRLHWGYFCEDTLTLTWNTPHVTNISELLLLFPSQLQSLSSSTALYIASVVPFLTEKYLKLGQTRIITVDDLPVKGIYSTMGIDRALALYGAGSIYSYPCLVIDGGTALTFTGANQEGELIGGAILPGVRLQLQSLAENTGALPRIDLGDELPPLWAKNTPTAINSGVIYTICMGIIYFSEQFRSQFPQSQIIFTGGDGLQLKTYVQTLAPNLVDQLIFDPNLIFHGINNLRNSIK
jgi:type III pantothenate kinase